jgi:hypothetical protein
MQSPSGMLMGMKPIKLKSKKRASDYRPTRAKFAKTWASPMASLRAQRRAQLGAGLIDSDSVAQIVRNLRGAKVDRRTGRPNDDYPRMTYSAVAKELERLGRRTPRGSLHWTATQVKREEKRPSLHLNDLPPILGERHTVTSGARPGWRARTTTKRSRIQRDPRTRANESSAMKPEQYINKHGNVVARPCTRGERALIDWEGAQMDREEDGLPREPQPRIDSRGRPLKGRRFSKIRKAPPKVT